MKKIIKSRIFYFILGMLLSGVTVYAANYAANEISFTTSKNSKVKTVKDALDDLYDKKGGSCSELANKFAWTYEYTGEKQVFKVPGTGTYKLEVWGASGGNASKKNGGLGGYSVGNVKLNADSSLYIYVGGAGVSDCKTTCNGGYNGGGSAVSNAFRGSGGGATHIAFKEGVLSDLGYEDAVNQSKLLIAAGGGGGAGYFNDNYSALGGAGGGLTGIDGNTYNATGDSYGQNGSGATQKSGGDGKTSGTFGHGGDANNGTVGGAGGGGGFYGGGSASNAAGAGGGSGYIGGVTNGQTISGNSEMPTHDGKKEVGHSGNGYVKITYVGN